MKAKDLMAYLEEMDPEADVHIVDDAGLLCDITAVTERLEKTFTAIGEFEESKSVIIECVEAR